MTGILTICAACIALEAAGSSIVSAEEVSSDQLWTELGTESISEAGTEKLTKNAAGYGSEILTENTSERVSEMLTETIGETTSETPAEAVTEASLAGITKEYVTDENGQPSAPTLPQ